MELSGTEKTSARADMKASSFDDSESGSHTVLSKGHTQNDKADMSRMGKEQELRVCLLACLLSQARMKL